MKIKKILFNFINRPRRLLGIDIGHNFIRSIELSYDKTAYQVEACAYTTINAEELSDEMVIVATKNLLKQVRSRAKDVAIAIAHSAVTFKEVQVDPALSPEEIAEFLRFNLVGQFGNANFSFDYQAVATEPNGSATLQVVMVRRERVEKWLQLLQTINLRPKIIDVDIYAMARAVRWQLKTINGVAAIVNINYGDILIAILDDKKIVYIHEDFVGDENLGSTTQIVEQIDLKLKLVHVVVSQRLSQVVLAGEKATLLGLSEEVSARLKLQTTVANPFLTMQISSTISRDLINQVAPMMLTSCGLALRVADGNGN